MTEHDPGGRPRARYPLSRLLLVVVLGFVASSLLQLLVPELGTVGRLSVLVIVAALISLAVTFRQRRGQR
ncbi:hypothetical protein AC792_07315 [Arthrobacter sp. RIT-PI-e]|uniref:hypothetical protein n=1 Tax=Arthrobacter sp. RIT-PI-e TaxID=1681197 RepID=UPI000675E6F5|nr:hypothetical protein [Arthrobacter sp. RIT-PI-e]KNC19278.1 hypothetical protein AC792_07315 [Arthrobacter sp. RIT-PI-e]